MLRRRVLLKISSFEIDISTAVVTASAQTYTGSALTPSVTVTLNGSVIPSTGYDVTYSNNVNAGTGNITVEGKNGYRGTATGTFTINKANPVYTAPVANTGLTYNGSPQYLTTAGSTNHGTIWYSANGSSWSTTQVYQTDAGTYTSYWKLTGDANHYDTGSTSIITSIAQATGTVQFGSSAISLGYDGGSTGTVYVRAAANCGWAKTADKSVSGYNVYKSVSNYYQNTSYAVMKLTFVNSTGAAINTTFKVGPAMESVYDYTYITQWDASDVTYDEPTNPLYSGKSKTDTWTDVAVTIPTGTHTIQFVYRKDYSVNNSPDCGYVAIPYDVSFTSVAKNMPKYLGSGIFTWSSSNSNVATVTSSGQVTVVGTGTATISVSMAADSNATGASSSYTLTIETIVPIGNVSNFSYIGAVSTKTLSPGTYKLQCWGAQGGSNAANSTYSITAQAGGKGGYSEGVLTLTEEKTLYIFVGGQGSSSGNGGWNGGGGGSGSSAYNFDNINGVSRMGCGGGATDIALTTSSMSYSSYRTNRIPESLLSRMIVAGGGSGGAMCYKSEVATVPVSGTPTQPSSTGTITLTPSSTYVDASSFIGKRIRIKCATIINIYANNATWLASSGTTNSWIPFDFTQVSYNSMQFSYSISSDTPLYYEIYDSVSAVTVEKVSSWQEATIGSYYTYTDNTTFIALKENSSSANLVFPEHNPYNSGLRGWYFTGNEDFIIDGYVYNWNGSQLVQKTTTQTVTSNESQVGYVGGGTTGGGYSSTYKGKQNAAGSGGAFGYGANQTATDYRYCSGAGGGGWYGGGGGQESDSTMTCCKYSGGGSGFVNTASSASYRPSGYTGLQLDSGSTYDGNQTFKAPSGSNETGHSGNGYARITRL